MIDALGPTEIQNAKTKVFRKVLAGFAISLGGLSFLSMFSSVHTTVNYGWPWVVGYFMTLFTFLFLLKITPAKSDNGDITEVESKKKIPHIWAGILGIAVMTGYSVFSGVPTLMHHFTSAEGVMEVTVVSKESKYQRGVCRPRLVIKEFTFFLSNHICPNQDTYDRIDVGTVLILKGEVSQFGVESKQFSWPRKVE